MKNVVIILTTALLASGLASSASADSAGSIQPEDIKAAVKARSYSPYAGRSYPTQVYWGDTHVHTDNSLDARGLGVTLDVEDAFRFARGEEVTTSHGLQFKLSRALDWLVVTDHSDGMGAMKEIISGNPKLLKDETVRGWHQKIKQGGDEAFKATMDVITAFSEGKTPEVVLDKTFQQTIWDDYLDTVERFDDPGTFTTLIGYEWTSTEKGNNLHRNVIYRDNQVRAQQMVPYTTAESFNPEDLWTWMETYEKRTGGQIFALAHNGNLSNGIMFPVETNPATGEPLNENYVKRRAKWEPLYEATQMKGDGESHPYLSPDDEFADYHTWDKGNLNLTVPKTKDMLQYEYAREALKNGLAIETRLGINPYKFGMIGSTDTHTALSSPEEDNYIGKHSGTEPEPGRMEHIVIKFGENSILSAEETASGYTGVWATKNTRKAIWDAMARKEVYATTGSRMLVRFFGGWDFTEQDINNRLPASVGYEKGVPMGGDLSLIPEGKKAPTFLAAALKDPLSGNLDRMQIVKGWVDKKGKTHEKVYNVAWSNTEARKLDADGKLPEVGNTVDVKNATWKNSIGDSELFTVWTDPDFDPAVKAVYYARVLEIPTPRWTAYDAFRFGVEPPEGTVMVHQERAYTSPIWYTPATK
ncbi:MAG: hypothetical protein BA863_02420 [Desulfovibrio sp. S3730MH75]|nr:MAG: hypothetical protein BA863_02420 [Desulfovibrio sp. S3730MH75]